jgi:hypothetical protein
MVDAKGLQDNCEIMNDSTDLKLYAIRAYTDSQCIEDSCQDCAGSRSYGTLREGLIRCGDGEEL